MSPSRLQVEVTETALLLDFSAARVPLRLTWEALERDCREPNSAPCAYRGPGAVLPSRRPAHLLRAALIFAAQAR